MAFSPLLRATLHRPAAEPVDAADADTTKMLAERLAAAAQMRLGRSLAIRPVAAGGCNGCEVELRLLASAVEGLALRATARI